jgi:hypothetical protein
MKRETRERLMIRLALQIECPSLQVDYDLIAEDERIAVRLAEADALEAKYRRIADLQAEIGLRNAGESNACTPPRNRKASGGVSGYPERTASD